MHENKGTMLAACGFLLLLPGSILVLSTHSSKDGEALPATCICTSKPHRWKELRTEPDGSGGTRVRTVSRCKARVRAVTTSLSMINMTVETTIYDQCSYCPGPAKCYVNSDSCVVNYSELWAESAMESYIAGFILVGVAGICCLAAGFLFLLPRLHRRHRARAQARAQAAEAKAEADAEAWAHQARTTPHRPPLPIRAQPAGFYRGDYGGYHPPCSSDFCGSGAGPQRAQVAHVTPSGTLFYPYVNPLSDIREGEGWGELV